MARIARGSVTITDIKDGVSNILLDWTGVQTWPTNTDINGAYEYTFNSDFSGIAQINFSARDAEGTEAGGVRFSLNGGDEIPFYRTGADGSIEEYTFTVPGIVKGENTLSFWDNNGSDGGDIRKVVVAISAVEGSRTVQGTLYYEKDSAGAPSAPTGNTYTFSTGAVSGTGIGTGVNTWTNEPRTQDPTSANTHYTVKYYGTEPVATGEDTLEISYGTVTQYTNFTGVVSFTDLSTEGSTTIHGGNIETDTIDADAILVDNLAAISANLGNITAGTIDAGAVTINNLSVGGTSLPNNLATINDTKNIAVLINQDVSGSNVGEAILVGYTNGVADKTLNGFITYKGTEYTIDVTQGSTSGVTILTAAVNKNGYIVYDSTESNKFTTSSYGNRNVAFVWFDGTNWRYDPNNTVGTVFTPTDTDLALGIMSTSTSDLITSAELFFEVVKLTDASEKGTTTAYGNSLEDLSDININEGTKLLEIESGATKTGGGWFKIPLAVNTAATIPIDDPTAFSTLFQSRIGRSARYGDIVLLEETTGVTKTYQYKGSWNEATAVIRGDMLVRGTVTADRIDVIGNEATIKIDGNEESPLVIENVPEGEYFKVKTNGRIEASGGIFQDGGISLAKVNQAELSEYVDGRLGEVGTFTAGINEVVTDTIDLAQATDTVCSFTTALSTDLTHNIELRLEDSWSHSLVDITETPANGGPAGDITLNYEIEGSADSTTWVDVTTGTIVADSVVIEGTTQNGGSTTETQAYENGQYSWVLEVEDFGEPGFTEHELRLTITWNGSVVYFDQDAVFNQSASNSYLYNQTSVSVGSTTYNRGTFSSTDSDTDLETDYYGVEKVGQSSVVNGLETFTLSLIKNISVASPYAYYRAKFTGFENTDTFNGVTPTGGFSDANNPVAFDGAPSLRVYTAGSSSIFSAGDISVSTGTATGGGSLAYDDGAFTFKPADLSGKADLSGATFTGNIAINGLTSNIAKLSLSEGAVSNPSNVVLEYDGTGSGDTNYFHIYSEVDAWVDKGDSLNIQPSTGKVDIGATTFTEKFNVAGNVNFTGTITASGYNNSNWDTAYTYSQVGHLPLAGGTLTGPVNYNSPDTNSTITTTMLDGGTLSFSGSAGQLFSISDSMTGTIFSVNDVSGIPSLEVDDDGTIRLAEYSGNILVGTNVDDGTNKLQVNGTISSTTPASSTNDTTVATTAFVKTQITDLVGGAPGALDTLNELAAAINDDSAFSSTVTTALGNRLRTDTNAQGLSATEKTNALTNLGINSKISNWDTAYTYSTVGHLTQTVADTLYVPLGTSTESIFAPRATPGTGIDIDKDVATRLARITGDRLSSAIRVSITGTTGGVVVNVIADIMVNHSGNIQIATQSSDFTSIELTVISDNNENFDLIMEYTTGDATGNFAVEIFPLASETVTWDVSQLPVYTGTTVVHTTGSGTVKYSQSSGNVDISTDGTLSASGYNDSNWNTAYGWGDHSTQNYAVTTGDTFTGNISLNDNVRANFGTGNDFTIFHNGTDTILHNDTGFLKFEQDVNDGDIQFNADNGSGGLETYYYIDGSLQRNVFPNKVLINNNESSGLSVGAVDSTADRTFYAANIDLDLSGSDALTADRVKTGLLIDVDSSATGGDQTDEHRIYGLYSDVRASGDSDKVTGGYFYARSDLSTGNCQAVYGVDAIAYDNGSGTSDVGSVLGGRFLAYASNTGSTTTPNLYGSQSQVISTADLNSSQVIPTMTASYNEIEITNPTTAGFTVTELYGVRSIIDNNADTNATLTNSYLFHGKYEGTLPTNAKGIVINGDVPNTFAGRVTAKELYTSIGGVVVAHSNISTTNGYVKTSDGGSAGGYYVGSNKIITESRAIQNITSATISGYVESQYYASFGGQELILAAGESRAMLDGVTGGNPLQDEFIYAVAEKGLQIISSPGNWSANGSDFYDDAAWALRHTATICDINGNSSLPGKLVINGGDNNSAKADLSVGCGGSPQISLYSNSVNMGGTDMNYNAKFLHNGSRTILGSWDSDIELQVAATGTTRRDIRFRPYTGSSTLEVMRIQGDSTVAISGLLTATQKSFTIDHPTKEGHKLRYGSLEGPENGVYVRGRLKDSNVIELPDVWVGLVHEDSITVSLTAIGKNQEIWVEDIVENKIIVGGDKINCFYHVFAERKDVDKLVTEFKEVE